LSFDSDWIFNIFIRVEANEFEVHLAIKINSSGYRMTKRRYELRGALLRIEYPASWNLKLLIIIWKADCMSVDYKSRKIIMQ
jgi:hypothetical protein